MGSMIILEVVLKAYAVISIATATDEMWNCNNPRPYPMKKYSVCQWDEADMVKIKGKWYLRPQGKEDNVFERFYRKRYWRKLGYDNERVRIK